MEKELFDDLITALNEAIAYEKGTLQLKTTTLTLAEDEMTHVLEPQKGA